MSTTHQADFIWIMAGMSVMWIYLLRPDWLADRSSYRIIVAFSIVLFLLAVTLGLSDFRFRYPTQTLYTPLFSAILHKALRLVFLRKLKREPIDTFFNWNPGLFWDRLFAMVFWLGSAFFLMALVVPTK